MSALRNARGSVGMFVGLLSLLISLAMIYYLVFTMLKTYFKPVAHDVKTQEQGLSEQGIDSTSYKSILDTTKDKVSSITTQQNQLFNLTQ